MKKKRNKSQPLRPATRSEQRQSELDRKRALEQGRIIYENWREKLVNTPTRSDELPRLMNELAMELQQKIKHPEALEAMIRMVDLKIADTYAATKTGLFMMRIHAVCPNVTMCSSDPENPVKNVPMICNFGFDAFVAKEKWAKGDARLECPQCSGMIHQKNMKAVQVTLDDPRRNQDPKQN